jgi:hypothetical protein
MPRIERFTFACDEIDRLCISLLAQKLGRSRSDSVRYVVRQAVLGENPFSMNILPGPDENTSLQTPNQNVGDCDD